MDITKGKTFCIMPWTGIATDPVGGLRPCCWMDSSEKFFGSVDEYETSNYLIEIKRKFLSNEYPESCSRCKWNDEHNIISKRVRENNNWIRSRSNEKDLSIQEYTILDFRLNNKCNLKCITCGPKSSSSIYEELIEHQDTHMDHYKVSYDKIKHIDLKNVYSTNDVSALIDRITPGSRVYFTGGEPSLVKPSFDVLETLLNNNMNDDVVIQFNSNFQAFNKKWVDLLKEFKGLMMPSIDAVGFQAEYIRYGCSWESVDKNLRTFYSECKNFEILIFPTISILNIFYLEDLLTWTKSIGPNIRIEFQNRLTNPPYFDIKNMPNELKEKAREYLLKIDHKDIATIIRHMDTDADPVMWQQGMTNLERLDKIRNTNWKTILTELII